MTRRVETPTRKTGATKTGVSSPAASSAIAGVAGAGGTAGCSMPSVGSARTTRSCNGLPCSRMAITHPAHTGHPSICEPSHESRGPCERPRASWASVCAASIALSSSSRVSQGALPPAPRRSCARTLVRTPSTTPSAAFTSSARPARPGATRADAHALSIISTPDVDETASASPRHAPSCRRTSQCRTMHAAGATTSSATCRLTMPGCLGVEGVEGVEGDGDASEGGFFFLWTMARAGPKSPRAAADEPSTYSSYGRDRFFTLSVG